MASFTIQPPAYYKLFFHAAKHPHQPVNGVLLGKETEPGKIIIEDAIPLLHHWTSLSPMMEIGLDLAGRYAKEINLKLVGYYQACERLDDTALAPVGERVASKVKEGFKDAIAFVLDGDKLGTDDAALIPYVYQGTSWKRHVAQATPFAPGSLYQLAEPDLPSRAVAHVRDDHLHQLFGDFDDHLEDVTIDWLSNAVCLPAS